MSRRSAPSGSCAARAVHVDVVAKVNPSLDLSQIPPSMSPLPLCRPSSALLLLLLLLPLVVAARQGVSVAAAARAARDGRRRFPA